MALSITVHGQGTFTASMEEGPVTFTASIGSVGPQGATGATGPAGVVAATAPITYNSGTQTIGISATPTFTTVNTTGLNLTTATFADATAQTTAFVGEARKVYVTARNNSGSTIAAGKVVYLTGATGNKPTIGLAQANAEGTSARVIGITVESIANNADGKVITSGVAENIDTSAFTAGDVVYLSATTAGGMTTTLPTQPYHGVAIGVITRANPTVGSVEVQVNNYQELEELSDVLITSVANLDLLSWDSASSTWQNKTFSTLGLLTSATAASTYQTQSGMSAYLTTSSAASTYQTQAGMSSYLTTASASSTYQTQAGMSSYALLASPTFTGDPKAPTPSTSDNDTSIATTAFVNAYCPSASTSTAGKVELATEAETATGTSTSLAITPWSAAWGRLNPSSIALVSTDASSLTSGGTTAVSSHGIMCRSGTASGSYGGRVFEGGSSNGIFTTTGSVTAFNFSRRVFFSGKIILNTTSESANIAQRVTFGKRGSSPSGTDIGDLAVRGFGIRLNNAGVAATLTVHDGTTLTNVTSTFTPSASQAFDFLIYSDGAGNVTLYVNGSQVATSSAGPTGNSTTIVPTVYCETAATSTVTTATNTTLLVSNIKLDVGT